MHIYVYIYVRIKNIFLLLMAANDIKQTLRKLDFPYCAKEALGRIGKTNVFRLPVDTINSQFQIHFFCYLCVFQKYYAADPENKWIFKGI